jgi:tRNA pseudouridine38-40 synthase
MNVVCVANKRRFLVKRYFLHIAYNGAPFCGWQRQKNAVSVQQVLEEAFLVLLREAVSVVGCGRTDTGVNASKYFVHFDIAATFVDFFGENFLYHLNAILPKEIVVYEIYEVPSDMHARFSALSRTYKYYIHTAKSPFLNDFSFFVPFAPDVEVISRACEFLVTKMDFTSFAKLHTDNKTNFCDLMGAKIEQVDKISFVFTFTANRFLRNMVRAMVGTLLEVGCRKISLEQFKEITEAKNRSKAGISVPAKALFLTDITYGNL